MTRNVFITGGSSGIGRAIAIKLGSVQDKVYITGRNENNLQNVISEVREFGGTGYYRVADVRKNEDTEEAISDAITKMGYLDVVIANAGVGRFNIFENFTDEDFNLQFDTNVRGVFFVIRAALLHMKKRGVGQIIVTSSNLGFKSYARCGLYAATKFAVQAMVGAIREELKGTSIKVATLNPGSVDTPWFDGKEVDRSKMLSASDVAEAAFLIINQSETSNIDHILLLPGQS